MRSTTERLNDILESIINIQRYTSQGRKRFDEDELVQTWVIRHMEIIGEAARNIPKDFKERHPAFPWRKINGMRNILVHMYFGIDRNVVWAIVEDDLPVIKASVEAFLQSE